MGEQLSFVLLRTIVPVSTLKKKAYLSEGPSVFENPSMLKSDPPGQGRL